jgi:hypothetical protein
MERNMMTGQYSTIGKFLTDRGNDVEAPQKDGEAFVVTHSGRPWYAVSPLNCGFALFTELEGEEITPDARSVLLQLAATLTRESEIAGWTINEKNSIKGRAFVPGPFDPVASEPLFAMWENDLDLLTKALNTLFEKEETGEE